MRLRTVAAKRFKQVENATAVIWKLLLAERRFRCLNRVYTPIDGSSRIRVAGQTYTWEMLRLPALALQLPPS